MLIKLIKSNKLTVDFITNNYNPRRLFRQSPIIKKFTAYLPNGTGIRPASAGRCLRLGASIASSDTKLMRLRQLPHGRQAAHFNSKQPCLSEFCGAIMQNNKRVA